MINKLGDIVEITWEDAWSENGYYSLESIEKERPYITRSVGIVIRDNKDGMSIAREAFHNDTRYRAVQHIPRAMIKKVRRFK